MLRRNKYLGLVVLVFLVILVLLVKLAVTEIFQFSTPSLSEYGITDISVNPEYYEGGTPPFGLTTIDGTCEYPAEFDYVRSKKKCNQYIQDTLDFVGYDTVVEMLVDAFGKYITKENI